MIEVRKVDSDPLISHLYTARMDSSVSRSSSQDHDDIVPSPPTTQRPEVEEVTAQEPENKRTASPVTESTKKKLYNAIKEDGGDLEKVKRIIQQHPSLLR